VTVSYFLLILSFVTLFQFSPTNTSQHFLFQSQNPSAENQVSHADVKLSQSLSQNLFAANQDNHAESDSWHDHYQPLDKQLDSFGHTFSIWDLIFYTHPNLYILAAISCCLFNFNPKI